ncbi:hypothetical protein MASR2M15_21200 [Anaerolineales bacterium]
MMRRLVFLIIILLLSLPLSGTLSAQIDASGDYAITNLSHKIVGDQLIINFLVKNIGQDARFSSGLSIFVSSQGNYNLYNAPLTPLKTNETHQFEVPIDLPNDYLPLGTTQTIKIEAGLDGFVESMTDSTAANNRQIFDIQIPATLTGPNAESTAEANFVIPLIDMPVSVGNGQLSLGDTVLSYSEVGVILAVILVLLIIALLVILILRMIFYRPPRFPVWHPPYENVPPLDPNSDDGRRQGWQPYAQNGSILAISKPGNLHVIKLLQGKDLSHLGGWASIAMRMSAYDAYGRILDTQFIIDSGSVKNLNKLFDNRLIWSEEKIHKSIRKLASKLSKGYLNKVNKKYIALPISLDIRFEGTYEQSQIVFELYQCQDVVWQRIDRWQPEMTMIGRTMQENYTYTIHGQASGEKHKEFKQRLGDDLEWILTELIIDHSQDAAPSEKRQYDIPDTLTGMEPVRGDADTDEINRPVS